MDLGLLKNLEDSFKNIDTKGFVNEFINELSNYLSNFCAKRSNEIKQEQVNAETIKEVVDELKHDDEINSLREENTLYQVVDIGIDGVYLQNTNNDRIFKEVNIPEEIKNIIGNDYILIYKDGKYSIEEDLTDNFFENLVDISEYKKIQEDFIKNTNILEIDANTRFNVVSHEDDYTILNYGDSESNIIKVPNVLVPYFLENETVLYYNNGKFYKDM